MNIKSIITATAIGFASCAPAVAQDIPINALDCITDDFAIAAHGAAVKAVEQNNHFMDTSTAWNRETRRHFNTIINAKLTVCGLPLIEFEEVEPTGGGE